MVEHGGALVDAIAAHGGGAADWLDLSTGISPVAIRLPALHDEVWRRLPDPAEARAVAELARRHYGGGALPVVTPGSQAAIQHLPALAAGGGGPRRVAILSPTYGEYAAAFARAGFAVEEVSGLEQAVEADAAVLVNPNNPDGWRYRRADLVDFISRRTGRLTVVDEAFADLHPDVSVAGVVGELPGLVVLRSFGKVFGLAGLRLGFAFASGDDAGRLAATLGPWAVSGPALAIARHVFEHPELVAAQRDRIIACHEMTRSAIESAGIAIVGGTGLFLYLAVSDGAGFRDRLARRHILARAFDHSPDRLRLGLVSEESEAARLASALRETLSEGPG